MDGEVKNLVVIDDEKYVCNIIMEALDEFASYNVRKFTNPIEAIDFISDNAIDLVLTDLVMGKHSGVQVLESTLRNHPDAVVILMTGYPTVKTAISVLKKGGYDYLIKPFKLEDLKSTISRGLDHQRIKRENVRLRSQLELMKVTEAVAHGMKLHPLLTLIADSAVKELSAEAASIILLDRKANKYRLRCLSGSVDDSKVKEFILGDSKGASGRNSGHGPTLINEEIVINDKSHRRSYISYPLISKGKNIGSFNLVSTNRFSYLSPGQGHLISLLASTAAFVVESNYMDKDLQKSYLMTIKALASAIEARDRYTAGHTDRVYRIAKVIARELGWNNKRLIDLRTGSILHDVGKIGVPDAILNKPGKLTDDETEIMKKHPELGARILKGIPFLEPIIPYVFSHHERYDGTGYPHGLAGEDIPVEGRVLAVADTFDAIMSDRPYRPSADIEKAVKELIEYKETQFDPVIVDAFVNACREGRINIEVTYNRKSGKSEIFSQTQKVSV